MIRPKYYLVICIIIGLSIWPAVWLTWAVGQARAGHRRRARTDDGRRPAAGGGMRRGLQSEVDRVERF